MQATNNKFHAVQTNGFASRLESDVFDIINAELPSSFLIQKQSRVILKPATERYSALGWKIDFKVAEDKENYLFVEAKGKPTIDFKIKLQLFENRFPRSYNRLIVVTRKKCPELLHDKHLTVITINELFDCLKAFRSGRFYHWLNIYRQNKGVK